MRGVFGGIWALVLVLILTAQAGADAELRGFEPPTQVRVLERPSSKQALGLRKAKSLRDLVSWSEATQVFEYLATAPMPPAPMRPLPWHHVQDGCYARAHLMARELEELGIRSRKIFVQGRLAVATAFASDHRCVRWRYHVAPMVRAVLGGREVDAVLDPAIFSGPVRLEEWIGRIAPTNEACRRVNAREARRMENPETLKELMRAGDFETLRRVEACEWFVGERFALLPEDAWSADQWRLEDLAYSERMLRKFRVMDIVSTSASNGYIVDPSAKCE